MTYATVHLHLTPHPAPTSLRAMDDACALASLFEARLVASNSHLDIRAPQNWIVGAAILAPARATDANLIMMGAFGHSRLREFLLGGATRDLIATSATPLFMSH